MLLQFSVTRLISSAQHRLRNLNLFPVVPPSTDQREILKQRTSTRVFIVLFVAVVIIVGGYISLVTVTKTVVVPFPNLQEYSSLHSAYSHSLICPCSQISINYDAFLHLRYTLHQICTSIFVSSRWYTHLYQILARMVMFQNDVRQAIPYIFQALEVFCEISNRTISTNLNIFFSTPFVTATVTPLHLFQSQMQAAFDEFVSSTRRNLLSSLKVIGSMNQANTMMSLMGFQYQIHPIDDYAAFVVVAVVYPECICLFSAKCVAPARMFHFPNVTAQFTVPGLHIGCNTVESLLQSSLICFYDQTCIDQLFSNAEFNSSVPIPALTTSNSGRNPLNATVEALVDQLMVEAWNLSREYGSYFNTCRPRQSSYTRATRNDAIFIITTLFGLIGGLITALRFAVPLAVSNILKVLQRSRLLTLHVIAPETGKTEEVCHKNGSRLIKRILLLEHTTSIRRKQLTMKIPKQAWVALQHLNLFSSASPTTNPVDLRDQRISTRIFIFAMLLSNIILLMYVATVTVTNTITVAQPSLEQYNRLYSTRSPTLSCRCSKISILYSQFLHVQHNPHQLCGSVFTTETFRKDFFPTYFNRTLYALDLRVIGIQIFQSMSLFCGMTNRTIKQSLTRLYSNQYVSAPLTSKQLIRAGSQVIFDRFLSSTTNDFLSTLRTLRDMNHGNALFPGTLSNYDLLGVSPSFSTDLIVAAPEASKYLGCDCSLSPSCVQPGLFSSEWPLFQISGAAPGLYIGCSTTEAVLQSSLKCFYNQTCVDLFLPHLRGSSSLDVTALDPSLLVRFSIQSTVQELVNKLVVETWNFSSSFDNYCTECQPTQCIYTVVMRNSALTVVTTLFGLMGGLSTILTALTPLGVKAVMNVYRRHQRRRGQVTPIVREG